MLTPTQDPFAAIAQPARASSPPPAAPAQDPFAAIAQPAGATPPAAPSSDEGGLGGWLDRNVSNPGGPDADQPAWAMARGAIKSPAQVVGNILDFLSKPHPIDPNAPPETLTATQTKAHQHMQDVADWLRTGADTHGWENVGAIGEQMLEFMGGGALLKLAGAPAEAARATGIASEGIRAGAKALGIGDQLKAAQQLYTTLKANRYVAGMVAIGLKATKDALSLGGQTYAHTEDPQQAAIAGAGGAILSGAAGLAGRYLQKIAPKNLEIAGEKMPALASQVNEAGEPIDTGARGAPAIAQAQQQGAAAVTRNVAQQATAQAIDRINQTRPEISPVQDPTRLLPSPEGSQPFTFSLETPPNESVEGQALHRAEPLPGSNTTPADYGKWTPADRSTPYRASPNAPYDTAEPAAFGPFERNQVDGVTREGRKAAFAHPATEASAIETRTDAEKLDGEPGPRAAVEGKQDVTRHGPMQTTNPTEATSWLRGLEDLQSSPEHAQMTPAQQAAIETQRKALNDQLAIYHRSPYAQRFAQANVWDSIEGVRTFGDAADQIQSQAQPVYATLDRVSDGKFNVLKETAKRAAQRMRNPASEDAFQKAQGDYRDAVKGIDDLINTHRSQVSTADYMTARSAWRDSSRLDELHSVFESMMNGVTLEQSDRGMTRVMTGNAKRLEGFLADGTNREQLKQLIGTEGLDNLTRITLLLKGANTARMTQGVADHVAHAMDRGLGPHVAGGGWAAVAGAAAGGGLAHMFGLSPYVGAVAGAVGARQILRIAATNPAVGNMVEYAVRNNVSPQIYAPLIARIIAEPFQQQREPESDETEGDSMAAPDPPGLIERGSLDIRNRPVIQNDDGTHSTEYSVSFGDDQGHEVLVPTIVNGRFLTPNGKKPPEGSAEEKAMFKRAWDHYLESGEHLGKFDNPEHADAYSQILHSRGEK